MTKDETYIKRCLQLAIKGKGYVNPNPMVGAVVVHRDQIIGEGYHRSYGGAHAEVNAINSVVDKSLLRESTIYVSLEPCSHHGKTPPCSQLLIDSKISKVVVACLDPFPAVSGRGVKMLQDAGIEVVVGVLEAEAKELNKEFITAQIKNRPYIYLKWAQTTDHFIDRRREKGSAPISTPISTSFSKMLVHKKRAEISSIAIGTNTAVNDNPSLSTRLWYGHNPVRIILDRKGRIPKDYTIFDDKIRTIVYTEGVVTNNELSKTEFIEIKFDENVLETILKSLKEQQINSVMVEGGSHILQTMINKGLWDEAFIETSIAKFGEGIKAPFIEGKVISECWWETSKHLHLSNS